MNEINELGVPCFSGSCSEFYLEKVFNNTGWKPKECLSIAKELEDTRLIFFVHPALTHDEITKTINDLQQVMALVSK